MASDQFIKGMLTPIVLKLLQEEGRMYGYEITRRVKTMTGERLKLTEGALYPCLHKLEGEGIITAIYEEVDNRKRKYYELTRKGKNEAVSMLESIQDFWNQMALIFNLKTAKG